MGMAWVRRSGWTVLRTLALAYMVSVVAVAFGQRYLIYPTWAAHLMDKPDAPLGTERVGIVAADGVSVLGFWKPPSEGRPVVLTFHGNASSPVPHAERFTRLPWSGNGWGVLAIAYRGYPGSTGSPTEEGLRKDAEAAWAFVRSRAPGAKVLLHGHSLGAAVAIDLAQGKDDVLGLYLEAPFTSMVDMARLRAWWLPVDWLVRDAFRSDRKIASLPFPVLVAHGDSDLVVPGEYGSRLAGLARDGVFRWIKGGDHVSLFGALDKEAETRFDPAR